MVRLKRHIIFIVSLSFSVYFVLSVSVDKSLSALDKEVIKSLRMPEVCGDIDTFDDELYCIRAIQSRVQELYPRNKCPEAGEPVEPKNLVKRGFGCCYDKARLIEKSLQYIGFKTRRVFLAKKSDEFPSFLILFKPNLQSHAVSEVLTKKGWLGVDSVRDIILVMNSEPFNYKSLGSAPNDARRLFNLTPKWFYESGVFAVTGLYSRNGFFYPPYFPFFEMNFGDFLSNFYDEKIVVDNN